MIEVVAFAVVIVGGGLGAIKLIEPMIDRWFSMSERRLALEERRVDVERIVMIRPPIVDDDPMPVDMVQWAMNESNEWAQEDMLKRMRELYDKLRDWEKVRIALIQESGESQETRSTFS